MRNLACAKPCAQAPLTEAPLLAAGRRGPVACGLGSGVVATYDPTMLRFDVEPDFSWFEVRRVQQKETTLLQCLVVLQRLQGNVALLFDGAARDSSIQPSLNMRA